MSERWCKRDLDRTKVGMGDVYDSSYFWTERLNISAPGHPHINDDCTRHGVAALWFRSSDGILYLPSVVVQAVLLALHSSNHSQFPR